MWFEVLLPLLFLLSRVEADDVDRCPSTLNRQYLRTFRDRCYFFVTYEERYWTEADAACVHMGGKLVSIPDADTQVFIMGALADMNFGHNGIWIGLSDSDTEGDWKWVSGEPVTYTNWMADQPGIAAAFEDCALMRRRHNYMWADYSCHVWPQYYSYICQFAMTAPLSGSFSTPTTGPQTTTMIRMPDTTTATITTPPPPTTATLARALTTNTVPITTPPTTPKTTKMTPTPEGTISVPPRKAAGVTYPVSCDDFVCKLECLDNKFLDKDGCPVCSCPTPALTPQR